MAEQDSLRRLAELTEFQIALTFTLKEQIGALSPVS